MKILLKKLKEDATMPSYAHEHDAGMDLYAAENVALPAGTIAKVPTGISMAIPEGYVGLVWDKSGLAINYGLKTLGGVIDSGYRGEVLVGITNISDREYTIEKGHKVAQVLIQKVESPELEEVADLPFSRRGDKGFGSTGK